MSCDYNVVYVCQKWKRSLGSLEGNARGPWNRWMPTASTARGMRPRAWSSVEKVSGLLTMRARVKNIQKFWRPQIFWPVYCWGESFSSTDSDGPQLDSCSDRNSLGVDEMLAPIGFHLQFQVSVVGRYFTGWSQISTFVHEHVWVSPMHSRRFQTMNLETSPMVTQGREEV